MTKYDDGKTLAAVVYERLRQDILSCRLRPNHRLLLGELTQAYDAGVSPIREALSRLAADGLVVIESQRGARVAPVSEEDLRDLLRVRQHIESLALRWAIEHGDDEWEAGIVAAFHRLKKSLAKGSRSLISDEESQARHDEFHLALVAACGSPRLLSWVGTIYDQTRRYRLIADYRRSWDSYVLEEHRAIMEATLARDADRACALFEAHVVKTVRLAIENIAEVSELPAADEGRIADAARRRAGLGRP